MWAQYLLVLFGQVALQMDPQGDATYGDPQFIRAQNIGTVAADKYRVDTTTRQAKRILNASERAALCTLCGMDVEGVGVLDLTHRATNECVTYHYKRWAATEVTELIPNQVLRYNVLTYNTLPVWSSSFRFIKKIKWIHERLELLDALQIETVNDDNVSEYTYLLKEGDEWVESSFIAYAQVMNMCFQKVTLDIVRDDYKCADEEGTCLTTRRVIEPDITQLIGKVFLDEELKWDYEDYKPKYCCRIIRYLGDVHDEYVKIYMFGEKGIEGPIEFINNDGRWRPKPKPRRILQIFQGAPSNGDGKGGESAAGRKAPANAQGKSTPYTCVFGDPTSRNEQATSSSTSTKKVGGTSQEAESLSEEMLRFKNERWRDAKVSMLRSKFECYRNGERVNSDSLNKETVSKSSQGDSGTLLQEKKDSSSELNGSGVKDNHVYTIQEELDDGRLHSGENEHFMTCDFVNDFKNGANPVKVAAQEPTNGQDQQKAIPCKITQEPAVEEKIQQKEAVLWEPRQGEVGSTVDSRSSGRYRKYDGYLRVGRSSVKSKRQRKDHSFTGSSTVEASDRHSDDSWEDEEDGMSLTPLKPSDAVKRGSLENVESCINEMVHSVIILAGRNLATKRTAECIMHVLEGAAESICHIENTTDIEQGPAMLVQIKEQCAILTDMSRSAQALTAIIADDGQGAAELRINTPGAESDETIPAD